MNLYKKENPESIQSMFGTIAKQYDRTNSILTFRMHHRWNKKLINKVMGGKNPKTILDLCAGTGEIAFNYLKTAKTPCETFLLDFCPEMLECARSKEKKLNLSGHSFYYIEADAQDIPLPGKSVDCITLAYGIRNVKNPSECAKESFRVLKPGGTFGILELTQPENTLLRWGHTAYMKTVLPLIGKLVTSNKQAYQYLCGSIKSFIPPQDLEQILKDAGFTHTERTPLFGGIATIITGTKN